MTIKERMKHFAQRFGKEVVVDGTTWRYYRVGSGTPILWLTGGLRRAGLGFAFMESLAARHTVVAPDYPPVQTIGEFLTAFDAILRTETIGAFALGGQSYGGLLAQAYLAHNSHAVERLVLSSTGPADYGKAWLAADYPCIAFARILPENVVRDVFLGALLKVVAVPEAGRAEWLEAVKGVVRTDLSRADVISHFAVAADLIRRGIVTPAAYRNWAGRVFVLAAENDPTQSKKDIPHYEKLFGRPVDVLSMGDMGHAGALFDPDRYVELLERALL
jgi:pimeloyl-ACP methyl ester carboxylesterase